MCVSDKGFISNPSNCECQCDKSCNVGEYFDDENCKCRKKLVNKLFKECTETVEELKLAENENENMYKFSSCTVCIVLFSILFTINFGIGTYFVYFHWYLKKWCSTCSVWYSYSNNNLLFLQRHYQSQTFRIKFVKNKQNVVQKHSYLLHWILQNQKNDNYENNCSTSPLYLRINRASENIEEKNGNRCLVFDFKDENKELLRNTQMFGMEFQIKTINGGEKNDYEKNYLKVKFNSNNDLPLNKSLKFHSMAIIIRSVFKKIVNLNHNWS